jgi:F0F1-type ATP synthase delta subunit
VGFLASILKTIIEFFLKETVNEIKKPTTASDAHKLESEDRDRLQSALRKRLRK